MNSSRAVPIDGMAYGRCLLRPARPLDLASERSAEPWLELITSFTFALLAEVGQGWQRCTEGS